MKILTLKWVILASLTLFGVNSYANEQIASTIQDLSPHIDRQTAKKYAIIIDKYSRKYKINWRIPVAIFRQESNFRINEVNYKTDDFGIGQLNYYWHIKKKEIDLKRLFNEPDYAIHETYKILYNLKKKYHTGAKGWYQWYTRYHSFRPNRRKRYYNKLRPWILQAERRVNEKRELMAYGRETLDPRTH